MAEKIDAATQLGISRGGLLDARGNGVEQLGALFLFPVLGRADGVEMEAVAQFFAEAGGVTRDPGGEQTGSLLGTGNGGDFSGRHQRFLSSRDEEIPRSLLAKFDVKGRGRA